mmetsp:Transcript_32164/g.77069  ORF Transcript_32164/g.77069 Transcript_32164/m.77069 type:complete len:109 (+) Transcript_32164:318-644(+)
MPACRSERAAEAPTPARPRAGGRSTRGGGGPQEGSHTSAERDEGGDGGAMVLHTQWMNEEHPYSPENSTQPAAETNDPHRSQGEARAAGAAAALGSGNGAGYARVVCT